MALSGVMPLLLPPRLSWSSSGGGQRLVKLRREACPWRMGRWWGGSKGASLNKLDPDPLSLCGFLLLLAGLGGEGVRKIGAPKWSLLLAHPSCVLWRAAEESLEVTAWCGGNLKIPVPGSILNKLGLPLCCRACRRGGGARWFFAGSGARSSFPFADLLASFVDGLQWLRQLDILLEPGRVPRRWTFFVAKVLLCAGGTCGDFNGTSVSKRLEQVTQRPFFFSSSSPARRRRHGRWRKCSCRITQGCVCLFLFSQGVFCNRGLEFPDYCRCIS